MDESAPIVLIGLRGSGKTTCGRALAERLGRRFIDLDDVTPTLMGETRVGDALKRHGEPAFRAAEMRALAPELREHGTVLALGGGTPTAPGAPEMLRASGARIVYLRATPETLRARLIRTELDLRPSLTGKGTIPELDEVFNARDALYRSLGETIDVDQMNLDEVVDALETLVTR
ncbi:MAG: shikimate kinase [Phycisphaerales bacterium]